MRSDFEFYFSHIFAVVHVLLLHFFVFDVDHEDYPVGCPAVNLGLHYDQLNILFGSMVSIELRLNYFVLYFKYSEIIEGCYSLVELLRFFSKIF